MSRYVDPVTGEVIIATNVRCKTLYDHDRREGGRIGGAGRMREATEFIELNMQHIVREAVLATRDKDSGAISTAKVADWLNTQTPPITTRWGKAYKPMTVWRILYEYAQKTKAWATIEYEGMTKELAESGDLTPEATEKLDKWLKDTLLQARETEGYMQAVDVPLERHALEDPVEEAFRRRALK